MFIVITLGQMCDVWNYCSMTLQIGFSWYHWTVMITFIWWHYTYVQYHWTSTWSKYGLYTLILIHNTCNSICVWECVCVDNTIWKIPEVTDNCLPHLNVGFYNTCFSRIWRSSCPLTLTHFQLFPYQRHLHLRTWKLLVWAKASP